MFEPLRRHNTNTKPRVVKARRSQPETQVQQEIVAYARTLGLEVAHVNNGAKTAKARARLGKLGVCPGVADLLIFDRLPMVPKARGLAIEVKATKGRQSEAQRAWEKRIEGLGWIYRVVRSLAGFEIVLAEVGLQGGPGEKAPSVDTKPLVRGL